MAAIHIQTATRVVPQCYAYTLPDVPSLAGMTKIGFTERNVDTRIREQTHTAGLTPKVCWKLQASFLTEPYGTFTDKDFHAYLTRLGVKRKPGTEWFRIEPGQAKCDFIEFAQNHGTPDQASADPVLLYRLRKEQSDAVGQTKAYFLSHEGGSFLWNAKPRFGKTLSSYDLCRQLGARNILIVTNRPAIANSWYSDYARFFGPQSGYWFVSSVDGVQDRKYVLSREEYVRKTMDEDVKGCIEFVSLQDLKGSIYFGGQYDKLAELSHKESGIRWDILIVDEAHEGVDTYKTDTAFDQIDRKWTLYLSGTPFKALANDKFPGDAIYNWTYADEQKAKQAWSPAAEEENPYAVLPTMHLYTYQMSDIVQDKVSRGIDLNGDTEEYAFDLNEFFATNESGIFVHDKDVDKFLDALANGEKFPFSTPELRDELKHTFWLLNRVASARALAKKLNDHPVFGKYKVVLAAGDGKLDEEEETQKSYDKVRDAIAHNDKTITLSVGQLTTGITIPEWTAVLMLSNMASPALYMQAAFRAQNPCLFTATDGSTYRKTDAYIFDFDPARTLTIFEQFANDLIPETAGDRGDTDARKQNVRELLNFFPVYGEDDAGSMVALDAEAVLTVPRHIHAKEVVNRGFMSNFLFANIGGVFGAPKEIIDLISGMQALEEPKKQLPPVPITDDTADDLSLNADGDVDIPREKVIGKAAGLFGEKVYADVEDRLDDAIQTAAEEREKNPDPAKHELEKLQDILGKPVADTMIEKARETYGGDLRKSAQKTLERKIREKTDHLVRKEYGSYAIRDNQLAKERDDRITEARKSGAGEADLARIRKTYEDKRTEEHTGMLESIRKKLHEEEIAKDAAETIVETVETERLNAQKDSIEGSVRDHLRGFSRTIPAFLMAYGDEHTTLANFDQLVPANVFWEVTVNPQTGKGVTLDQFRMLRDGGDYTADDGTKKHFAGHLFDEVVFDDAVQEFIRKRKDLADYVRDDAKGDIFDYIPAQRSNQIFTPKRVVVDMVDMLEHENPGCFDDPDVTFADLYMKSGMYVAEVAKRLFRSQRMQALYPDEGERMRHIFACQVYGCAPTEIIYRICLRYVLGLADEYGIKKHNLRLYDTLPAAKAGTLEEKLKKLYPELAGINEY